MKPIDRVVTTLATVLMLGGATSATSAEPAAAHATQILLEHNREFAQRIETPAEGVFVAVVHSASNVTLIQGHGGSIIVDTGANPVDARAIVEAFGGNLKRPVREIIYTHGHPDHTGGARFFAGDDQPEIYGHRLIAPLGYRPCPR
ncbi:MBL fold metallo-hydrolase [Xanthomonas cannabis]|uniref:MBL fold metallo-hydrolase n=1 Tax=Xanthomonas cannabis TaxID=1885674 RepID=UPI001ABA9FD7|nr:MBL fold metallo-hydrolase [Xanthomonas cannabis]NIK17055.1 glyoxylase-like metal-dependent hydrolase (beta-lactamase superfamily II) [Xanthomonas cannabis]